MNKPSGKIRFGVTLSLNRSDSVDLKDEALEREELSYYAIWLTDHLFPLYGPPSTPRYECWTSLSAIASVTRRLRLGTLVLRFVQQCTLGL